MFGVAGYALLAGAGWNMVSGMQTLVGFDAGRDFSVALEAAEGGFSGGELVTTGAFGRTVQCLVGARKLARRDLREGCIDVAKAQQQQ